MTSTTEHDNAHLDIWDRPTLLQRVNNREDRLKQLVQLFMDDVPDRIDALLTAIRQRDIHTVRTVAHTIKGVAGNMAARQLHQLAMTIEEATRLDNSDLDNYLSDIEQQSDRLFSLLRDQLGSSDCNNSSDSTETC